jgi:hypothetical protein
LGARRLGNSAVVIVKGEDRAVEKALETEMEFTASAAQVRLQNVVARWEHKPKFVIKKKITPTVILFTVEATGKKKEIFLYVDQGTGKFGSKKRSYQIPKVPKPETTLRFRTGYSPKTKPVGKFNVGPGKASGGWVSAKKVIHPGIKGRKFTNSFIDELTPSFPERITEATKRGLSRAHAKL